MRYFKSYSLLAIMLPFLMALPGWAITPPQVGEVLTVGDYKVLHGETDIEAPMETVWGALTDYGNLKHVMPGYTRSSLLQAHGSQKTVDLGLKVNPFIPELRYQVLIKEGEHRNWMDVERISGDFDALSASYQLLPQKNNPKATHLIYNLKIDFGIPVPGVSLMMRANMLRDLSALQAYCVKAPKRGLLQAKASF